MRRQTSALDSPICAFLDDTFVARNSVMPYTRTSASSSNASSARIMSPYAHVGSRLGSRSTPPSSPSPRRSISSSPPRKIPIIPTHFEETNKHFKEMKKRLRLVNRKRGIIPSYKFAERDVIALA